MAVALEMAMPMTVLRQCILAELDAKLKSIESQ